MEEVTEKMVNEAAQGTGRKGNKGWFRPGDKRINREGRPRGPTAVVQQGDTIVDCAPETDRLMLLIVRRRDVIFRLTNHNAPWIMNLPEDIEIVASRVDASRNAVIFTIRSREYHRVFKGSPIPMI